MAGASTEHIDSDALRREIDDLRAAVQALAAALPNSQRLSLRAATLPGYLGQPATLVATAVDPCGLPRVDLALTFVTSWGRLRSGDGLDFPQGGTITVRTGADGTARVVLIPPTSEDLWDDQQDALEASLQVLDPAAPTPAEAQAGLYEMARQYRWEAAAAFRRAVDVYLRDFRPHLMETVNLRDYSLAWATIESTVVVSAQDEADAAVRGSAVLHVRVKDWLGAWLEAYLALSAGQTTLRADLDALVKRGGDADTLVEDVQSRVQTYVAGQRGLAGAWGARKVAESSLRGLIDTGVADLPLDHRLQLFSTLDAAARTLGAAAGGAEALASVTRARADSRTALERKVAVTETGVAALSERLAGAESALATKADAAALSAKLDATTFTTFQQTVQTQLAAKASTAALNAKLDGTTFTNFQQTVQSQLAAKADAAALQEVQASLTRAIAAKADSSALSKLQDSVARALESKLDARVFESEMERQLGELTKNLQSQIDELRRKLR
jgi:hypothetical protein